MLLALLWGAAQAASLDNLEVGGAYGTPLATNPTAGWYNPANLAAGRGTRYLLHGAPTLATVDINRDDPYHGGADQLKLFGVIPFAGVASDFGQDWLGVGLSMSVPYARGGAEPNEPGPVSFSIRNGMQQVINGNLAVAFKPPKSPVSFGGGLSVVHSSFAAVIDSELTTALDHQIALLGQESGYTDAQIEDPDYTTTLNFDALTATKLSFNVGVRGDVGPVSMAVGYVHGVHLSHKGDLTMVFGCPPEEDVKGRLGAEQYGLCDATLNAHGAMGYDLPSRLHFGVGYKPIEQVELQAIGGYTMWSTYKDFHVIVSDVAELNPDLPEDKDTASLVEQDRKWARDNVNTFWLGLDVKGQVLDDRVLIGGRVLYDRSAIPSHAASANNYDANTVITGLVFGYHPVPWLGIGVDYSHLFVADRTISDSAFAVTLDPANRNEDRYFYPHANGTYSANIDRFGVAISGEIGAKKKKAKAALGEPKKKAESNEYLDGLLKPKSAPVEPTPPVETDPELMDIADPEEG